FFFFQAEDVIRDPLVTGVQTCALPISTGFAYFVSSMKSAASSSAEPPISPIKTTASVDLSSLNNFRTSTKFSPVIGSPPIPRHVDWPMPARVRYEAL